MVAADQLLPQATCCKLTQGQQKKSPSFTFASVRPGLSLPHSIYVRTVSSLPLLSTLLIHFKLVHVLFDQNNKNNTFDFYPRLARKETNVPLHKKS